VAGATAIQGVDATLSKLASDAIAALTQPPSTLSVTLGPLDRPDDQARLNWFLYRVEPNTAFVNMEPPGTGWRSAMGHPPLALKLHYLLTSHPGHLTQAGEEEQFAHRALTAVMQRLQAHAVIRTGDTSLSNLVTPLVEPLRISMEALDLEAVSKIWTAASHSLRLSVGYVVSLVVLDPPPDDYVAGPPVQERRVVAAPTMGPRLLSASPDHLSAGQNCTVAVMGMTAGASFTLAWQAGDPPGPALGWPLTVVSATTASVTLRVTQPDLAPGNRRVQVTATQGGLLVGSDFLDIRLVPAVTAPTGTVSKAAPVNLSTSHAAPDVEVFVRGVRLDPASVTFKSATQVQIQLPPTAPSGPAPVTLRAGKVAGPPYAGLVVGP